MPKDTHHQVHIEEIMDDIEGLGPDSSRRSRVSCIAKSIKKRKPIEVAFDNEDAIQEEMTVEDTRV